MKKHFPLLLAAAMLFLWGCQQERREVDAMQQKGADLSVAEKLKAAGFDLSQGFFKYQNGYMVEYDIFLTEAQIDELAASATALKGGRTSHYRTTNLVTSLPRTLQVYMDPAFGSYMQGAFDQALSRYNTLGLRLAFQRTTNAGAANISILAFYEVSNTLGYSGGFPANGNPASTIRLNTYYYNNNSQRTDATTTIAHEIGHAIGFRHTDYMNRAFSCGSGGNEGDAGVGAIHIPGTPTGPSANSWMLACSNNTDRPFTGEDRTSLQAVYGGGYWETLPGLATDIGVGADGTAYITGSQAVSGGYGIYRWSGSNWVLQNGGAVRVDVSPQGTPWVVNNVGNIFRGDGTGAYEVLPGLATDIGIGADGTVYIIGTDVVPGGYGIYRWNGSNWDKIPGGAVKVDVSPQGTPWVVNNVGNIFRGNGSGGFEVLPGLATDIGIGADGTVYITGSQPVAGGYGVYRWNGSNWSLIDGGGVHVSVSPQGLPWLVNDANAIFRRR